MPFDQHLCQVDLILRHVVVSGFSLHPAGDVKSGPVKSPWAHLHPGLPHFLYSSTRHPSVRTAASRMMRSRALRLRISKAAWLCADFQQRTPNRTTASREMRQPSTRSGSQPVRIPVAELCTLYVPTGVAHHSRDTPPPHLLTTI